MNYIFLSCQEAAPSPFSHGPCDPDRDPDSNADRGSGDYLLSHGLGMFAVNEYNYRPIGKMAITSTTSITVLFLGLCFSLLSLILIQQIRRKSILRRKRRLLLSRRRAVSAYYKRVEQTRHIAAAVGADFVLRNSIPRRTIWARCRSQAFREVISGWTNSEWKANFRVSREMFSHLCEELRVKLQRSSTIRRAVPVETRVAVALWRLGTNVEYRTISHLFGIGISTACNITHQVCDAIVTHLLKKYINIPQGNSASEIVRQFEEKWGFPQCFGAVDGSHVPIIPPSEHATDYYNRKGYHSIVLQALVDPNYRFMNVYVGWPGSVHDARIFVNSDVYTKGEAGTLLPNSTRVFSGVPVHVVILGDPAYPMLPWLIKPYSGSGLTAKQQNFNARLSRARVVVECAFGRLKGRWRCLLKRNDIRIESLTTLVMACCILHNMCEVHQDSFNEQWLDEEVCLSHSTGSTPNSSPSSSTATVIRDALCDYVDTH